MRGNKEKKIFDASFDISAAQNWFRTAYFNLEQQHLNKLTEQLCYCKWGKIGMLRGSC